MLGSANMVAHMVAECRHLCAARHCGPCVSNGALYVRRYKHAVPHTVRAWHRAHLFVLDLVMLDITNMLCAKQHSRLAWQPRGICIHVNCGFCVRRREHGSSQTTPPEYLSISPAARDKNRGRASKPVNTRTTVRFPVASQTWAKPGRACY